MENSYIPIYNMALPYLKNGLRKNLISHTKEVIKTMDTLLKHEGGNKQLLIPAAILHDIGWSMVPKKIQLNWRNREDKIRGEELHIEYAKPIIKEILQELSYPVEQVDKIISIVQAHKFQNPSELEKQLLIDADKMSDATRVQFYSDAKFYQATPEEVYNFRKKNRFHTLTAKSFFEKEMKKRKREIEKN